MKLYLILLSILFLSMIQAQLPDVTPGDCVNIKIPLNASWVNISTLTYPNQTMLSLNDDTTKIGGTFYYNTFCDTDSKGCYSYEFFDDTGYTSGNTFCTNNFSISQAMIYIIALIFLIAFILGLYNLITKLPQDSRDEEGKIIQINQLKHLKPILWMCIWLLILVSIFILANMGLAFLPNAMVGNLFFKIYQILFWLTIIAIPVLFIRIILKFFEDKEFKKLIDRGVDIGDM